MGASHSQPITLWSKGEYHNPTNKQDDFKVMSGKGTPVAPDDHPTPTPYTAAVTGVVETDADTDTFVVQHPGGLLRATATPARHSYP